MSDLTSAGEVANQWRRTSGPATDVSTSPAAVGPAEQSSSNNNIRSGWLCESPTAPYTSPAAMGKPGRQRHRRSPLVFFEQACRTELRRRHPGAAVSGAALSRACARRWQSTSAQERALFEHLARGWRGAFKARRIRDPLAPKRPLSAFFIFSSEQRPEVRARWPGLNYAETAKRLGEHWASLNPEQRQPFEVKAAALRETYRAALAAYQSKAATGGAPQGQAMLPKEEPPEGPAAAAESPLGALQRLVPSEGHAAPALGGGALEGHSRGVTVKEEAESDEGYNPPQRPPLEELSEEEESEEEAEHRGAPSGWG